LFLDSEYDLLPRQTTGANIFQQFISTLLYTASRFLTGWTKTSFNTHKSSLVSLSILGRMAQWQGACLRSKRLQVRPLVRSRHYGPSYRVEVHIHRQRLKSILFVPADGSRSSVRIFVLFLTVQTLREYIWHFSTVNQSLIGRQACSSRLYGSTKQLGFAEVTLPVVEYDRDDDLLSYCTKHCDLAGP
jgi:hypothetical protein